MLIGANIVHNIADRLQRYINIPLIHIAEATLTNINEQKINKIALPGTAYTMQMDFYKSKLASQHIETIIPGQNDIDFINHSIYKEFAKWIFFLKQNGDTGASLRV